VIAKIILEQYLGFYFRTVYLLVVNEDDYTINIRRRTVVSKHSRRLNSDTKNIFTGIEIFLPHKPRCPMTRTIISTVFATIIPIQKSEVYSHHTYVHLSASTQLTVTSKHSVHDGLHDVLAHLMFVPDDDLNINGNSESLPLANAAFLTF
jgi:hypothetical protein